MAMVAASAAFLRPALLLALVASAAALQLPPTPGGGIDPLTAAWEAPPPKLPLDSIVLEEQDDVRA